MGEAGAFWGFTAPSLKQSKNKTPRTDINTVRQKNHQMHTSNNLRRQVYSLRRANDASLNNLSLYNSIAYISYQIEGTLPLDLKYLNSPILFIISSN